MSQETKATVPTTPTLPGSLRLFLVLNASLAACSALFAVVMCITRRHPPYGLPLSFSAGWFTDLFTTDRIMWAVHLPQFFRPEFGWIYPAPCIFVYELFLRPGLLIHHGRLPAAILYCFVGAVGLAVAERIFYRRLVGIGIKASSAKLFCCCATLCSWPLWFCVHQGNIEMVVFVGICAGAYLIFEGRWMSAALVIGTIASVKIYPILLLGMLLAERKYKQITAALLVFALVNILALAYIGPTVGVAWRNTLPGLASFKALAFVPIYVDRNYLCFDHSLVALGRVLVQDSPRAMVALGNIWIPACAAVGTLTYFLRVQHQPKLNQLAFFVCAMLLLPPKSFDYTSLALYTVFAPAAVQLVHSHAARDRTPALSAMVVLLAVPLSLVLFARVGQSYFFGQLSSLAIGAVAIIALCCSFSPQHGVGVGGMHA